MPAAPFYEQLAALEREGAAFVFVVLVDALGSTPQDTGAKMLVTPAGLLTGSVGGGKVEAKAIEGEAAIAMLTRGERDAAILANWTRSKTDDRHDLRRVRWRSISNPRTSPAAPALNWPHLALRCRSRGAGLGARARLPLDTASSSSSTRAVTGSTAPAARLSTTSATLNPAKPATSPCTTMPDQAFLLLPDQGPCLRPPRCCSVRSGSAISPSSASSAATPRPKFSAASWSPVAWRRSVPPSSTAPSVSPSARTIRMRSRSASPLNWLPSETD